jgi:hypothetical protein
MRNSKLAIAIVLGRIPSRYLIFTILAAVLCQIRRRPVRNYVRFTGATRGQERRGPAASMVMPTKTLSSALFSGREVAVPGGSQSPRADGRWCPFRSPARLTPQTQWLALSCTHERCPHILPDRSAPVAAESADQIISEAKGAGT